MKKYFIQFNGTGCTLAVEKHLGNFIHERYKDALVWDTMIDGIVDDLEREQDAFFSTHRGNRVEVSSHRFDYGSTTGTPVYIHAGQVGMTLIPIKHEYLRVEAVGE